VLCYNFLSLELPGSMRKTALGLCLLCALASPAHAQVQTEAQRIAALEAKVQALEAELQQLKSAPPAASAAPTAAAPASTPCTSCSS